MRPSELSELLQATIAHRAPVLITGAPGIGKTDIVTAAAEASGADLIVSHPVVSDPTDAKGLPWPDKDGGTATFLPFGDLARAIKAERPTVWFLDDLGQASPSVQASFMQLLLARRINDHALPECVTFIAATNRRTDRAGVSGILEPVKSRFATIVELDIHLDDWCNWAVTHGIRSEVIAFLRFKSDLLCKFSASQDLTNSPVPRTWAHASRLLDICSPAVVGVAVAGAVGAGAAGEFMAYLKVFRSLPDIDALLEHPHDPGMFGKGQKLPTEPGVLYALVTSLAMRATDATAAAILVIAERLTDKGRGEFAALLVRDAVRRHKAIAKTKAFIGMANGPLGSLIFGE